MSRKLKNLLKNIPDVIELKVDEEEIAKDLKKELMAHGLDKGTAIDISQEIASGFIYKYVQNLFIRKDLSLDKKKKTAFDLTGDQKDTLYIYKDNWGYVHIEVEAEGDFIEVGSRNITVNCVAPGFIDTNMTRVLPEEVKENLVKQIPLARLGSPEDIAAAVAFLASPQAAYITGSVLHVNGGMFMN